jgi:hypothetical protein
VPDSLLTEAERDRVLRTSQSLRCSTRRPPEDIIEYHNESLRIVDDELWAKVQARFKGRARTAKGGQGYQRSRTAGFLK